MRLVADEAPGLRSRIAEAVSRQLPASVRLRVERVDAIPVGPGEKRRMVVSELGRETAEAPLPVDEQGGKLREASSQ